MSNDPQRSAKVMRRIAWGRVSAATASKAMVSQSQNPAERIRRRVTTRRRILRFALQDELASAIVQAVRDKLNGSVDTVTQGPPAQDLEAYQLYLRGRALMDRGTEQIRRAIELLRQAVARDPTLARAYSAMALAHYVAFLLNYPMAVALEEAERDAERALAIDTRLAEAHGVLGAVYAARLEWLKADASLRAAWALAENDAFTRTQHGLLVGMAAGHLRQAEEEVRAAHRLAPANAIVAVRLASVLFIGGSRDEAVRRMSGG